MKELQSFVAKRAKGEKIILIIIISKEKKERKYTVIPGLYIEK